MPALVSWTPEPVPPPVAWDGQNVDGPRAPTARPALGEPIRLEAGVPAPAGIGICFTDRTGGRSRGAFRRLNLGLHVGDDATRVTANREDLARAIGVEQVQYLDQVHGRAVAVVDAVQDPVPVADAVVTRTRGLALAIMTADCVPVLAADPVAGVVGAAHAGRAGMMLGVVPALLERMVAEGADLADVHVWIGPSICGACYEVPRSMQREALDLVPQARATTRTGTPALDLVAGVRAQLATAGVAGAAVWDLPACTKESFEYFSHRRAAPTGRQASLIWLR